MVTGGRYMYRVELLFLFSPSFFSFSIYNHFIPILRQVYADRHEKAEWEEQMLWEKWQTLRKSTGQTLRGRSKSRRWREMNYIASGPSHVAAASIGRRTVGGFGGRDSTASDCSSMTGRLSPRSRNLREIVVGNAPPTPLPSGREHRR